MGCSMTLPSQHGWLMSNNRFLQKREVADEIDSSYGHFIDEMQLRE